MGEHNGGDPLSVYFGERDRTEGEGALCGRC